MRLSTTPIWLAAALPKVTVALIQAVTLHSAPSALPNSTIQLDMVFPRQGSAYLPTAPFPFVFMIHNFNEPWASGAELDWSLVGEGRSSLNDGTLAAEEGGGRAVAELHIFRESTRWAANTPARGAEAPFSVAGPAQRRSKALEAQEKNGRDEIFPHWSLCADGGGGGAPVRPAQEVRRSRRRHLIIPTTPYLLVHSPDSQWGGNVTEATDYTLRWGVWAECPSYEKEDGEGGGKEEKQERRHPVTRLRFSGEVTFSIDPLRGNVVDVLGGVRGEERCADVLGALELGVLASSGDGEESHDEAAARCVTSCKPVDGEPCLGKVTADTAAIVETEMLLVAGCANGRGTWPGVGKKGRAVCEVEGASLGDGGRGGGRGGEGQDGSGSSINEPESRAASFIGTEEFYLPWVVTLDLFLWLVAWI